MSRVAGWHGTGMYEVEVTGDPERPVVGHRGVAQLVADAVGEQVLVTPTGPVLTVALDDPASVRAVLHERTDVVRDDGSSLIGATRLRWTG